MKRFWVRKMYQERKEKREFHLLVRELKIFDQHYLFQQFRMNPEKLEELLKLVAPRIVK